MNIDALGTGVLLPAEALTLLGAGEQGATAILNYRLGSDDFDVEFAKLEQRLGISEDVEAPAELVVSRVIADAASRAHAWFSLRSEDAALAPAILLLGEGVAVAAILHGATVEYVIGGTDLVVRVLHNAVLLVPSADVHINLFVGDVPRAGVRVHEGAVDLMATDSGRLDRLTNAARSGLVPLLQALVAEAA